jgi:short-subunit dehydrogenase
VNRKYILITGASQGIGKTTFEYIASHGYSCVLVSRRENILQEIIHAFDEYNIEHKYYCCDLNDLKTIDGIFSFLENENIKLSGFVHCAGIAPVIKVSENDIDIMLKTFNVNFFSFIEIVKNFLSPKYSYDNSSIVAISSITAKTSTFTQCIYGSSKAALNSAVKHIAKEAIQRGITINAIMPGPVKTQMLMDLYKENYEEKIMKIAP